METKKKQKCLHFCAYCNRRFSPKMRTHRFCCPGHRSAWHADHDLRSAHRRVGPLSATESVPTFDDLVGLLASVVAGVRDPRNLSVAVQRHRQAVAAVLAELHRLRSVADGELRRSDGTKVRVGRAVECSLDGSDPKEM